LTRDEREELEMELKTCALQVSIEMMDGGGGIRRRRDNGELRDDGGGVTQTVGKRGTAATGMTEAEVQRRRSNSGVGTALTTG